MVFANASCIGNCKCLTSNDIPVEIIGKRDQRRNSRVCVSNVFIEALLNTQCAYIFPSGSYKNKSKVFQQVSRCRCKKHELSQYRPHIDRDCHCVCLMAIANASRIKNCNGLI